MPGGVWSAEEQALLKRAGRLYELQWSMAYECEPELRKRSINSIRNTGKKLMGDDTVGESGGGLRIDTDPEAVAQEASLFCRTRQRAWVPSCIKDHLPEVEPQAETERPDPTDRRATLVTASKDGERVVASLEAERRQVLASILAEWDQADHAGQLTPLECWRRWSRWPWLAEAGSSHRHSRRPPQPVPTGHSGAARRAMVSSRQPCPPGGPKR